MAATTSSPATSAPASPLSWTPSLPCSCRRTLRSYVLGHFKSERSDLSVSARPVSLRDRNNYTVTLGVFRNEGYDQTVTLAQVFWVDDSQSQPEQG